MAEHLTGDHSLLKSINRSSVLDLIRRYGPISRADLAKITKLTRATVSAQVEELIAFHWVEETGIGQSSGGRRPTMLEINRSAGYFIGLDLRATEGLLLAVNLIGEPIRKKLFDYQDAHDPEITLKQVAAAVKELHAELPVSPLGLCGVGIGIHGFVEHPGGQILFVPRFGWKRLHWKPLLEEEWGVPVWVDNEANLAALGELERGAAADCSQVLYVSVGAGIGAGFILDGEIFRGTNGYSGEVGHTTIERNGLPCSCGNRGCLELYASEKALAEKLGLDYKPGITAEIIGKLKEEDPAALQALREVGLQLGAGIGNLIQIFDPQMVVIGNALADYRPWLGDLLAETVENRYPFVQREPVDIRYSQLGDEACAIGAAFMGIRNMIKR